VTDVKPSNQFGRETAVRDTASNAGIAMILRVYQALKNQPLASLLLPNLPNRKS